MIRLGLVVRAPLRRPPGTGAGPGGLEVLIERAGAAEAAGFHGFFVDAQPGEPVQLSPGRPAPAIAVDPFVVLGAVAVSTSKLILGCLATPFRRRPPGVLAKVVTSLDVCSDGRAVLALSPESADPGEAELEALSEALEVCRALVRVTGPSFAGRHYELERAFNEPRYDHAGGGVPISVVIPAGATTPSRSGLLDLAARFAESVVVELGRPDPGELEGARELISSFARRAGRLEGTPGLVVRLPAIGLAEVELRELARRCADAGAGAVVLDYSDSAISPDRLEKLGAALIAGSR